MAPDSPDSPWENSKATRAGPAAEVDTSIFLPLVGTSVNRASPGKPAKPTVVGGHEQVIVTWSAPSNPSPAISGYDVQYWIRGTVEYTVASYGATVTQATITGLSRGNFYKVKVRANNSDGHGDWSDIAEARVYRNNPPEFDDNAAGIQHSRRSVCRRCPGRPLHRLRRRRGRRYLYIGR